MQRSQSTLVTCSIASVTALAAWAAPAQATLLIHESFDYAVGESIVGKSGGTGFAAPWAFAGTGTATIDAGLEFGQLITSGGSLRMTNQTSTGADAASATRLVGVSGPGTSFWSSYLVRMEQTPPAVGTVLDARYRDGSATGASSVLRNGAVQNNQTNNPGVAVTGAGTAATIGLAANTTYLMVANFTGTTDNNYTSGTMWVLTEAGFNSFIADGGDLAALNTHAFATATNAGGTASLDAGSDHFNFFNFAGNLATPTVVVYDEYRLGTTLADVTPIPEPASLALLGIGGALMLSRRRARATNG